MEENRFFENLLNLENLEVQFVDHQRSKIIVNCTIHVRYSKCPNCSQKTTLINQYTAYNAQDLSISGKEVWLRLKIPQFVCQNCNRFFKHQVDWIETGKSYTKRQARWVYKLCAKQAFTEVAAIINRSVKTVERIYYNTADREIRINERLKNVRWLGIDEIAHRKGKGDYVCVLTDLQRGIHIDILEFRTKDYLMNYFRKLGENFCSQITKVSCDFWASYINLSKELFKHAQVVVDHFHIVKLLNEPLDFFRKKLRKENKDIEEYKKIKWILFKRPEFCSEDDKKRLKKAFNKSSKLRKMYDLRNGFHEILALEDSEDVISQRIEEWMNHANSLQDIPFSRFIKTIRLRKEEVIAFTQTRISNAVTEGLNNVIRYMKRISFGLPNFEHMRIRVLAYTC